MAPASAAAALMLTSGWLADQSVGYVIAVALATALALWSGLRWSPRAARTPLVITVAALLSACLAAGRAELRLGRFERDPAMVSATQATEQEAVLRRRLDDELAALREVAMRGLALGRTTDPAAAVAALHRALGDDQHRAALVLRGDTLVVWAGTVHASPLTFTAPSGVVATYVS